MDGSVRGTHQLCETFASVADLICEYPLQYAGSPERAAVMKLHVQRTDAVVFQHLGAQHPRTVCASVRLGAFEDDSMCCWLVNRAVHSQPLAPGKRSDPSAQLHVPRGFIGGRRFDAMEEVRPTRVLSQIIDVGEQLVCPAGGLKRCVYIHSCSIADR